MIGSAAVIIRRAFEPACRYTDGRTYTRVSSAVHRSVRSVPGTLSRERDLHNGDLSFLAGTEFNANSPLQEVLKAQPRVRQDEDGSMLVQLPDLDMKSDLKLPKELARRADKIRVHFVLLAF